MNSYIAASSKPWHRAMFDRFRQNYPHEWLYVADQAELEQAVATTSPRYIFFLHWNWLVPEKIWSNFECVCFHMTDVPFGRGGSPLQNLIAAGVTETMVTALRMIEEMDAGPVYAKRPMTLEGRAEEIYRRAGELSWDMIRWIVDTEPVPVPQEGEATSFTRRKPAQSELPRQESLECLYDHIRMLDAPTYPLAFVDHGDFRIELSHAEIQDGEIVARAVLRSRRKGADSHD